MSTGVFCPVCGCRGLETGDLCPLNEVEDDASIGSEYDDCLALQEVGEPWDE